MQQQQCLNGLKVLVFTACVCMYMCHNCVPYFRVSEIANATNTPKRGMKVQGSNQNEGMIPNAYGLCFKKPLKIV